MEASFYEINAENGQVDWSIKIADTDGREPGNSTECFSAPVIINRLAFFLYKPTKARLRPILFCVDITGRRIKFATDIHESMGKQFVDGTIDFYKRLLRSSPLIVENSIYVGTGNGYICSFDTETGKLKWTVLLTDESAIGHIAYCNGCLYAQSGNRDLYAVNIAKRSVQWKFEHSEDYRVSINWYDVCPMVVGDAVYIYGSLKNLYAVDRKTGKLMWQYKASGLFYCRNFVATETLLIGAMPDSLVHAVDAKTGRKIWTANLGDTITGMSPSVILGSTLFTSSGGYFFRVSIPTGQLKERWGVPFDLKMSSHPFYLITQLVNSVTKFTTGSPNFSSISSPCIAKEGIFVATETEPDFSIYKLAA